MARQTDRQPVRMTTPRDEATALLAEALDDHNPIDGIDRLGNPPFRWVATISCDSVYMEDATGPTPTAALTRLADALEAMR